MARNRRSADRLRFSLLAGWLFADLFVVLFIISLASGAVPAPGNGAGSPSPFATAPVATGPVPTAPETTASRTPASRPTPTQRGVLQGTAITKYVPITPAELQAVYANPGSQARWLLNGLLGQLTSHQKIERVGFIQLFLPGADSNLATQDATTLVGEFAQLDRAMFGGAATQGLWHGNTDNAEFQIFFVALYGSPPHRVSSVTGAANTPPFWR